MVTMKTDDVDDDDDTMISGGGRAVIPDGGRAKVQSVKESLTMTTYQPLGDEERHA
jgi:hypothetical protein